MEKTAEQSEMNEKYKALGRIAATVMRESLIGRMETLIARDDWDGAAQVAEDAGLQWLADGLRKDGNERRDNKRDL